MWYLFFFRREIQRFIFVIFFFETKILLLFSTVRFCIIWKGHSAFLQKWDFVISKLRLAFFRNWDSVFYESDILFYFETGILFYFVTAILFNFYKSRLALKSHHKLRFWFLIIGVLFYFENEILSYFETEILFYFAIQILFYF